MRLLPGTLGQLTLWGGASPLVPTLIGWILTETWPARTHFYWCVSESMTDSEFMLYLLPAAVQLMGKGHTVEMWRAPAATSFRNEDPSKHQHIAGLYRDAFKRGSAKPWLLSIEDDNLPPPRALEQLAQHAQPDIGQIGGVYRIRGAPHLINVSTSLADPWTPPLATDIPNGLFPTPMMGAGFTLYNGEALRRMPPVVCRVTPQPSGPAHVAGWDDHVGRSFAEMGYRAFSDGSLWIGHHTPEVMAYLTLHNLPK